MHSVSESSDCLPLDPLRVVCHLTTLIIEGRTPRHRLTSTADSDCSNLKGNKPKPYDEGPHCPEVISGIPKQGNHKCNEEEIVCIRYQNLLRQLEHLGDTIVIEVYLAPNCPCAELRSESTIVSDQANTDDALLEQWIVHTYPKRSQERAAPIANVYQALRSSLHFSQLAAWYVTNDGQQPGNVVYRVCAFRDAVPPAPNMTRQRLPVSEVDKKTSIELSVLCMPRMAGIPGLGCSLHKGASPHSGLGDKFRSCVFRSTLFFDYDDKDCDINRMPQSRYSNPPDMAALDGISPLNPLKINKDHMNVINPLAATIGINIGGQMSPNAVTESKIMEKKKIGYGAIGAERVAIFDEKMPVSSVVAGKHRSDSSIDEDDEMHWQDLTRRLLDVINDDSDFTPKLEDVKTSGKFRELFQETLEDDKPPLSVPIIEETKRSVSQESFTQSSEKLTHSFRSIKSHSVNAFLSDIERCGERELCRDIKVTIFTDVNDASTNTEISSSEYPPEAKLVLRAESPKKQADDKITLLFRSGWDSKKKNCSTPDPAYGECGAESILPVTQAAERPPDINFSDNTVPPGSESPVHEEAPSTFKNPGSVECGAESILPVTQAGGSKDRPSDINFSDNTVPPGPESCDSDGQAGDIECEAIFRRKTRSLPLLGSFEENIMRDRISPISTVVGYSAKICATGAFFLPHVELPVVVSFYPTHEDYSGCTPYLGKINIQSKGCRVPRSGNIQLTLFNPENTVVHIFMVKYDFENMPNTSYTFLRQQALYVPREYEITDFEAAKSQNFSKYIMNLRFSSGKSGNIYLHNDIKFLVFKRADADTASMLQLRGGSNPFYNILVKHIRPDPIYTPKTKFC